VARSPPQASIFKQVPIQDTSHDAVICILTAYGTGLEQQEQPSSSVLICVIFSADPLRANMDETDLLVVITEQGENRNPCEEQRNIFGFYSFCPGFARRCET